MEYTVSNIINAPREAVVKKFQDPNGVKQWMEGLDRMEHISGTPGQQGAVTDFYFEYKGKIMKIEETILEQNLPDQIKFSYKSPRGTNEVEVIFSDLEDGRTQQLSNNYFPAKGLGALFMPLMKGMFKKQSLKYLDAFKAYVEQN